MLKNLTQVYCLTVCLVASLVMMITIGIMLGSGTDLVFTEYKHMRGLSYFSSDEAYIDYKTQGLAHKDKEQQQDLLRSKTKEKRLADREDYIEKVKGDAISSIINCATWLITGLLFFIIHWKMYRCCSSNKE